MTKYRPNKEFLESLGFKEKSDSSGSPYGVWHEIDLSSNLKLSVCCFSDFNLEVKDSFTEIISIQFECDKQLIDFVESFKK